jgi:hypothetical protein
VELKVAPHSTTKPADFGSARKDRQVARAEAKLAIESVSRAQAVPFKAAEVAAGQLDREVEPQATRQPGKVGPEPEETQGQ